MTKATNETDASLPANIHIEDHLIHIQRHKITRGRYELYIHNSELRAWIKNVELMVPQEQLNPPKRLGKKNLFYSVDYGQMLQSLCTYLDQARKAKRDAQVPLFLQHLEAKKLELWQDVRETENPWDGIYQKLSKIIKTALYEDRVS